MQLLETIGDMVWILTWIAFLFAVMASIVCAGIFIVAKLIEYIKKDIL
jgi:hypothetical protein